MQGPDIKIALLLAAVAAGAIGAIVYNVLPLYLGPLQDSAGLSNSQLGLIAGAYFLGSNLTGISSYFWVRRVSPRYAAIAATLLLIAFLLLTARFDSFVLQLLNTVFIGGASGALYAISVTIIGDTRNTPRWFGIKFTIECLAGVVLLYVLPVTLIPGLGFTGVVYGMVLMILVFSPALLYLPQLRLPAPQEDGSAGVTRAKASRLPIWFALAALLLYFIGASAIWAFLERLATNNNFEPSAIGALLGTTLFFAVIGAVITAVIGDRFGNLRPAVVYSLILVAGVLLLCRTDNFILFSLGAYAYMMAWSGADGYLFAIVADADPDGRHIALAVPAFGIGSMIGPVLAGYLYSGSSTLWLFIMLLVAISSAVLLAWRSGASN